MYKTPDVRRFRYKLSFQPLLDMDSKSDPSALLHEFHDIGDRMLAALEEEDVETFGELVRIRGSLLERITNSSDGNEARDEWSRLSGLFGKQFEALERKMVQLESKLEQDLAALGRYKGAQKSYAGTSTTSGILHSNVRG